MKNNGQKDVWRIVSAEGIPAQALPASQNGVTMSKAILTMDGKPANLATVKQNDRFIVRLSGEMADNRARLMALLDLLPAGFEIEGAVQRKDDGSTIYPFLPVLASANIAEARDDRFVTTFDIGSTYQPTDPKEAREASAGRRSTSPTSCARRSRAPTRCRPRWSKTCTRPDVRHARTWAR